MNKYAPLGLFALVTLVGTADAAVVDKKTCLSATFLTTLNCATNNGVAAGTMTGSSGGNLTITVNLTKGNGGGDVVSGSGRTSNDLTACVAQDRNPSLGSTDTDTDCAGSTFMRLIVSDRNDPGEGL
jgi:hypothetical protein